METSLVLVNYQGIHEFFSFRLYIIEYIYSKISNFINKGSRGVLLSKSLILLVGGRRSY